MYREKPNNRWNKNAQKVLDRLVAYQKNPLIISLKDIDKIKLDNKQPCKDSIGVNLMRLEKLGAIIWYRTGKWKFTPYIEILRTKI